jgi:hypothetical protein
MSHTVSKLLVYNRGIPISVLHAKLGVVFAIDAPAFSAQVKRPRGHERGSDVGREGSDPLGVAKVLLPRHQGTFVLGFVAEDEAEEDVNATD